MEYSLYQPPPKASQVVLDEEMELSGSMNIPAIVVEMELTADFLRLAYLGVLGNRELHKIIQNLQFDIVKLAKLFDTSIVQLRIKSGDIINDLECGFAYLLEGHEEFALENFKSISETSKTVLKTVVKLKGECEAKEKAINEILTTVTKQHRAQASPMCSAASENLLKYRIGRGEKETAASREKCTQLQGDIRDSKAKISKEARAKKPVREDFFKWVKQGYLYTTELDAVATDKEKMLFNMAKEERLKEIEEMKSTRESELRANREMMKMVQEMKKIGDVNSDGVGNFTVALRGAETGVKSLLAALQPVIAFWEMLAEQCESIAKTGTERRLEQACAKDPEKGKEFWTCTAFKRQALKFYAR
jgi:hypothetical protein